MIPVEDQPRRDCGTRLWIDAATTREVLLTTAKFLLVFVVILRAGLTGDDPLMSTETEKTFPNSTHRLVTFTVSPLSSVGRFVRLEVAFLNSADEANVWFRYKIVSPSQIQLTKTLQNVTVRGRPVTDRILLFQTRVVPYDKLEVEVDVHAQTQFRGVVLFTSHGSADQTFFQVYFRLVFSVFEMGAFVLFCKRLNVVRFFEWAFEQQLTAAVVVIAVISNNPLYYYVRGDDSFFPVVILGSGVTPLLHAVVCLSVLVVLHSVVDENAGSRLFWTRREVFFAVLLFVIELIVSETQVFRGPIGPMDVLVERIALALNIVFPLWVVWLGGGVISAGDLAETGRSVLYSFAALIVTGCAAIATVVSRLVSSLEGGLEESLSIFIGYNVFTLMMIYFHWPYEPDVDRLYDGKLAGEVLSSTDSADENL
jgi:hypothetical protein